MNLSVTIKYIGSARDDAETDSETISIKSEGTTVMMVLEQISDRRPKLYSRRSSLLYAINQNYAVPDSHVRDGDEIAIFPVVSGG